MALTPIQRTVCRLLADARRQSGESYVAGGVALNELTAAGRISRDIDVFHDTEEAVHVSWTADRSLLVERGFDVHASRERPGFVEAEVCRDGELVRMEWARDSSFRFFPLVTHETLGLTLHPFDLATNKLLALVGRREVRDWIDVITSHERVQRLGYLSWAAAGKDLGFSPSSILEHAARTARFAPEEVRALAFAGDPPDIARLGLTWREMLEEARGIIAELPAGATGRCVLTANGELCQMSAADVRKATSDGMLRYHEGRIRGAWPELRPSM